MRLIIIIVMLFFVNWNLGRIVYEAHQSRVELVKANCLTEAKQGVQCEAAKP